MANWRSTPGTTKSTAAKHASKHASGPRVSFVKVKESREHAAVLYELLKKRKHTVSHKTLPTKRLHERFVFNHPYRAWYLIKVDDAYAGSIYILKNNSVGVSAWFEEKICIAEAIMFVMEKHKPLPAIKSVRAGTYDFNVAPTNETLIMILKNLGAKLTQLSFVLDQPVARARARL
jgi:hypothetical protein